MYWQKKISRPTRSMKGSMIMDLIEKTRSIPGFISFAGGSPASSTFPRDKLAPLFKQVVEEKGEQIFHYGFSGGDEALKQAIIKQEKLSIALEQMQICSGAANGIYSAMRTYVDRGDIIIVEAPSFLGSLVTFEAAEAKIIAVPLCHDGIDLDILTDIIRTNDPNKIKLIYTIPDFQNPTGITMSDAKRRKLIKIAIDNNIVILEDAPYTKLRLSGEHIKSLFEIAADEYGNIGVVVSVRSFSKLLGPGIRVGYVLGDKQIIDYMNSWLQKEINTTDRISQNVVAEFLNRGFLAEQITIIKDTYKPLHDKMSGSLKRYMPSGVEWTDPDGGMFFWLKLPQGCNSDSLLDRAVQKKVAFLPGSNFYPAEKKKYNYLRLNFTFPSEEQIEEGIDRLAEVIKDAL